jgi:hypothetical protein
MSNVFPRGSVAHYEHLRAIGRGLHPKIREATADLDFDIIKAAKKLTIPVHGRTVIFADEIESVALMDFYLHEFRKGGRRLIDWCDPDAMGLSTDERELIEAHREGRTSLFEVVGTDAGKAHVLLRDVLSPGEPEVILSDIALSGMGDIGGTVLFFVRVLVCQEIAMSSGCFFAFATTHRERLHAAYALRMETVPPGEVSERRFVFFFQQHREFGEAQGFVEPE